MDNVIKIRESHQHTVVNIGDEPENVHQYAYSLRQIANWELRSSSQESEVLLPALQRDLVWKPQQAELLWDSILRRFPIGSFVIEETGSQKYLLDGQQRTNAITLGLDDTIISKIDIEPNMVLWIDLKPKFPSGSTRKFMVKSTTVAHPWGYKNGDNCDRLTANERRNAIEQFGLNNRNIYQETISLRETWPVEAILPIPLGLLINAVNSDDFNNCLQHDLSKLFIIHPMYKKMFADQLALFDFTELQETLRNLYNYRVSANILDSKVNESESEDEGNDSSISNVEILFERLGTKGTQISQSDLAYSAIKAYWGTIRNENDRIAKFYMPSSVLIMLAFRLVYTQIQQKTDGFSSVLSLKAIRTIAKLQEERVLVENLYLSPSNGISEMALIMEWVEQNVFGNKSDNKRVPSIIRTTIARQYPEIYLLLIHFARKIINNKYDIDSDTIKSIKALTLFLPVFCNDTPKSVNLVYKYCINCISSENIVNAIYEAQLNGWLKPIVEPEEFNNNGKLNELKRVEYWDMLGGWWDRSSRKLFMLYYAQREYLNTVFANYDPAKSDFWESHNRPWDLDHIIPKDRIDNKRSEYRERCKAWLWNIGNCAAIPFEKNRSKNNRSDWEEYTTNSELLMFNEQVVDLSYDLVRNEIEVKKFGEITFSRSLEIYRRYYKDSVEALAYNSTKISTSSVIYDRKLQVEQISANLSSEGISDLEYYYVERERQIPICKQKYANWAYPWVSIGKKINDEIFACIFVNSHCNSFELGLVRPIDQEAINSNYPQDLFDEFSLENEKFEKKMSGWWYVKYATDDIKQAEDEFIELLTTFNKISI